MLCVAEEGVGGARLAAQLRDLAGLAESPEGACDAERERGAGVSGRRGGDALARTVRGRAGRGAPRLHGQPPVRPAAVAPGHPWLTGPRPRAGAGRAARRGRGGRGPRRARAGGGRAVRGHVRLRADGRGHAHGHRATGHRARRPGRRQPPHRPQPQRPGGHRPAAVVQGRATGRRRCASSPSRRCCSSGPRPPAARTCRATPTCSGPSPCCWPTTCWPTAGRSAATSTGCWRRVARLDVSPLGAGALAGSSLPLDPAGTGGRPRLRRRLRQLASTPSSDRDFVAEALFDLTLRRHPPLAHRRGVGAVDERGVRLRPPRRRLRHRLVDDAAEEEPRHRRAGAGQGRAAHRRPDRAAGHAEGPAARLQPRPPGGQGAAVRRGRPGAARPRRHGGHGRDGDLRARADAGRGRRPATAATDLAEWLVAGACRSATPTRSSARWCGGRWTARATWRRWSPPTPPSGPRRPSSWPRGWRSAAAPLPAAGPGAGCGAAGAVRRPLAELRTRLAGWRQATGPQAGGPTGDLHACESVNLG